MLMYPRINPIALQLGVLKIRWYGLMYLLGFFAAWGLLNYRAKHRPALQLNSQAVSDIVFYAALGVVLGGRIGYILFYDFANFIAQPQIIFKIWEGGMSFHGGMLGVILALYLYCKFKKFSFISIMDFITPVVPIGLGLGRLGNFINGELWGRVTSLPWGMVFPQVDAYPRHPSQLYEFLLEGVALFIVLWVYSSKQRPKMATSALFVLGYGLVRLICEFFRQPDAQIGFIAFGWLTKGQLLSLPMIILGGILLFFAYRWKEKVW